MNNSQNQENQDKVPDGSSSYTDNSNLFSKQDEISEKLANLLDFDRRSIEDPLVKLFLDPKHSDFSPIKERESFGATRTFTQLDRDKGLTEEDYKKIEDKYFIAINPGSTSSKIVIYQGLKLLAESEVHIPHDADDGLEPRKTSIIQFIESLNLDPKLICGFSTRGGFVAPVRPKTYKIVQEMLNDLKEPEMEHASNMGIALAIEVSKHFTNDNAVKTMSFPVNADETNIEYKMTGFSKVQKKNRGAHYLNHKSVYETVRRILALDDSAPVITAHLGGGVSFVRHENLKATNATNAFSLLPGANRSGFLPLMESIIAMRDGEISMSELENAKVKNGGLLNLAGTNSFKTLEHFYHHGADEKQKNKIEIIFNFFARQYAIGIMRLALDKTKAVCAVITGGLARSETMISKIKSYLHGMLPIFILPGAYEHQMMVAENIKTYLDNDYPADYVAEKLRYRRKQREDNDFLKIKIFENHIRRRPGLPITDMSILADVVRQEIAASQLPVIGIIAAQNEDAMIAAKMANEDGKYPIARFALIGDYKEINSLAWEFDVTIDGKNYFIVDTQDPVTTGVQMLLDKKIDIIMKGGVKTEQIMHGYIKGKKDAGLLKKGCLISHIGIFEIPTYPKLLMVSDAAVMAAPTFDQKLKIIENAIEITHSLNIKKPKLALISAIEKPNKAIASSLEANDIAQLFKDRTDCIVEGPLSFDIAVGKHIAEEKKYQGQIQGDADVLIVPDIVAGNVIYKSLTVSAGATTGGIIIGGGEPVVLTSRGDSARSKFASICLTIRYMFYKKNVNDRCM